MSYLIQEESSRPPEKLCWCQPAKKNQVKEEHIWFPRQELVFEGQTKVFLITLEENGYLNTPKILFRK